MSRSAQTVNGPALFVGLRIGGEARTADAGRWRSSMVAVRCISLKTGSNFDLDQDRRLLSAR